MKINLATLMVAISLCSLQAKAQANLSEVQHRIETARVVLSEIKAITDTRVPSQVRSQANCVAVFPVTNMHSEVGPDASRVGIASCKNTGVWSAPVFLRMVITVPAAVSGAPDIVLIGIGVETLEDLSQTRFALERRKITPGPVASGYRKGGSEPLAAGFLAYGVKNAQVTGLNISDLRLSQDEAAKSLLYGPGIEAGTILSGRVSILPWAIPVVRTMSEVFK